MIVPILIDTSDITSQFEGITQQNVDNLCDNVAKGLAASYARQLEEEAQKTLHQTRKRYIQNIRLVDSGKLEGTVLLDYSKDKLIKMLEEGADAFDEKIGLLNSSKVKYTKDGRRYITVPFRLATPGAVAESDAFSGVLPQEVYDVIKQKVANKPISGGGTQSKGLTLNEIPSQFQQPQTRAAVDNSAGNKMWEAYMHKNSLYEGLVKQTDAVTGQNTYHTFRRVSEGGVDKNGKPVGSDPDSWINGGIRAYHLIQQALNNFKVEQETGKLIDEELNKLGFETE